MGNDHARRPLDGFRDYPRVLDTSYRSRIYCTKPAQLTTQPGNPTRGEIVELYAQKSGRAVDDIVFYFVFGVFKIAVIVQQIYYRSI